MSMMAWFSGCVPRAIPSEDGILHWEHIRKEIKPLSPHAAPTGLVHLRTRTIWRWHGVSDRRSE